LADLGAVTLVDYLTRREPAGSKPQLLMLDQFEEILTLDPYDQPAKEVFFVQVIQALRRDRRQTGSASDTRPRARWALFSMRDEHVAALSPYIRRVPTGFGETYRLDLLNVEAALQAIRRPADQKCVTFPGAAALKLVDYLRRVR